MNPRSAYAPPGWPHVIPRLSVSDPGQCVSFLQEVFDASGGFNEGRPSELRIGDGMIMVAGILDRAPTSAFLYVYVPDVDVAFEKALVRGAREVEAPQEMPYGDRRAMIEDPWGNRWQIATHRAFAEAPGGDE